MEHTQGDLILSGTSELCMAKSAQLICLRVLVRDKRARRHLLSHAALATAWNFESASKRNERTSHLMMCKRRRKTGNKTNGERACFAADDRQQEVVNKQQQSCAKGRVRARLLIVICGERALSRTHQHQHESTLQISGAIIR